MSNGSTALTTSYVRPGKLCRPGDNAPKRKRRKRKPRVPRGPSVSKQLAVAKIKDVIHKRLDCSCSSDTVGYFDSNSTPCVRTKFITKLGVGSGTGGNWAVQIRPTLANQFYSSPTLSGSAVSNWGSGTDATGYDSTNFQSYRTVSMCVRYFAFSAPTDSAGIITAAVSSPQDPTWSIADTQMTDVEFYRQYQADFCICPRPEGPETRIHEGISDTANNGWPTIYVGGRGHPVSTSVGEITIEHSVEMHVTAGTVYNFFLQPGHNNIPQLESAITNAQAAAPQIIDNSNAPGTSRKTFLEAAEDAAVSLVESLSGPAISAIMALI